jgi:hypothetical protein
MENKETNVCGMNGCTGCGCGHHHMHIMKWIVKIAVVALIFSFAFKMGELKGMLESRGYDNSGYGHRYGGGMMYGAYGTDYGPGFESGVAVPNTTMPAVPATPKK